VSKRGLGRAIHCGALAAATLGLGVLMACSPTPQRQGDSNSRLKSVSMVPLKPKQRSKIKVAYLWLQYLHG
jgi:hypothetical protein